MSLQDTASFAVPPRLPCFIVGVTGHIQLQPQDCSRVREQIRGLFQRLMASSKTASSLPPDAQQSAAECVPPLALHATQILLLSSLAPGADQLAAEVALELGIRVMAPLPFLPPTSGEPESASPVLSGALFENSVSFLQSGAARDENAQRQQQFRDLAARLERGSLFPVLLLEDSDLDAAAFQRQLAADAGNEQRRNRRFRAAGEFIAASSDLLIAVCNQTNRPAATSASVSANATALPAIPDDSECGTSAVLRVRLFGVTPGLLPGVSALTWADNGPVFRIWAENGRSPEAVRPAIPPLPELWYPESGRFLTPLRTEQAGAAEQLISLADEVSSLHRRLGTAAAAESGDSQSAAVLLQWKAFPETNVSPELGSGAEHSMQSLNCSSALQGVAQTYLAVNAISLRADRGRKSLLRFSPWLAFAGFLLLQFSENWPMPPNASPASQIWRVRGSILGIVMFVLPWIWSIWLERFRVPYLQENYRALAEATRIQFYWSLAGISKSVAQNYLLRERSHLSWIRAVVSSAAFPAQQFRAEFDALDAACQQARLEAILNGWIRTQHSYSRRTALRLESRHRWLSLCSSIILSCGLTLLILRTPAAGPWLPALLHLPGILATVILLLAALLAVFAGVYLQELQERVQGIRDRAHLDETEYSGRSLLPEERQWAAFVRWSERPLCRITSGVTLAFIILVFLQLPLPGLFQPGAGRADFQLAMLTICRNLMFIGYAILIARITFHFLPQNVPRYSTMTALYRGARLRMTDLLRRLECSVTSEQREQTLRDLRELLEHLGTEALVENAEWLKMHQISPPSPLLPSP